MDIKTYYQLELWELNKILRAYLRAEEERVDLEMQRTAWAVSLIMNSSGNYKKAVKPKDLYTTLEDRKLELEKKLRETKSRKELETELLQAFKL